MKLKAIEWLNDGNRFVVPMFPLLFIKGKERKIILESFDPLVRWRLPLYVSMISHQTLIWSYYIFRKNEPLFIMNRLLIRHVSHVKN